MNINSAICCFVTLFWVSTLFSQDNHYYFYVDHNCLLKTTVDNLYLRSEPSVKSTPIKKIKKNTELLWNFKKSPNKDTVIWNGEKVVDYWYMICYEFSVENGMIYSVGNVGWVFGKGIKLVMIDFANLEDHSLVKLNNDWLKVEFVSKLDFDKLKLTELNWIKGQSKNKLELSDGRKQTPFTLKLQNGKSLKYKNESVFNVDVSYIGDLASPAYYFVYRMDDTCGSYKAIRKSDGKNFVIPDLMFAKYEQNYIPIISPDRNLLLATLNCEPKWTYDTYWVSINEEEVSPLFLMERFIPSDFRFESSKSGIAKVTRSNNVNTSNYPEKVSYLRITLK